MKKTGYQVIALALVLGLSGCAAHHSKTQGSPSVVQQQKANQELQQDFYGSGKKAQQIQVGPSLLSKLGPIPAPKQ